MPQGLQVRALLQEPIRGWRAYDPDGATAEASRRRLLGCVIADKMMICGYHFLFPGAGTIAKDGTGYALTVIKA